MVEAEMYSEFDLEGARRGGWGSSDEEFISDCDDGSNVRQQAICGWHRKQLRNGH